MPMTVAYRGNPNERTVAITIDDFDSAVVWPEVMRALDRNPDAKVTLFPIGRNIPRLNGERPDIWRGLLAGGHEIGYHSLEHTRLAGATVEHLRNEISQFNALVAEAVGDPGFRVRWCRAPFGDHGEDWTNFRTAAAEMGVIWVLWQTTPSWVTYDIYASDSVRNGDIALFHDRWQDFSRLEPYMQVCRERGFRMVTLSGMSLVGD
jgi:peptidoglycan/xylan/chitin deacetylase (PgdA/CDA1 family)